MYPQSSQVTPGRPALPSALRQPYSNERRGAVAFAENREAYGAQTPVAMLSSEGRRGYGEESFSTGQILRTLQQMGEDVRDGFTRTEAWHADQASRHEHLVQQYQELQHSLDTMHKDYNDLKQAFDRQTAENLELRDRLEHLESLVLGRGYARSSYSAATSERSFPASEPGFFEAESVRIDQVVDLEGVNDEKRGQELIKALAAASGVVEEAFESVTPKPKTEELGEHPLLKQKLPTRSWVVKMWSRGAAFKILRARNKIRNGCNFFVNENLTEVEEAVKDRRRPYFNMLRSKANTWVQFRGVELWINTTYKLDPEGKRGPDGKVILLDKGEWVHFTGYRGTSAPPGQDAANKDVDGDDVMDNEAAGDGAADNNNGASSSGTGDSSKRRKSQGKGQAAMYAQASMHSPKGAKGREG